MHNFETGNLKYIEQARISKFWQKVDSMSATSASSHNLWLNVCPTLQKHPWFPFWGFPVSFLGQPHPFRQGRTDDGFWWWAPLHYKSHLISLVRLRHQRKLLPSSSSWAINFLPLNLLSLSSCRARHRHCRREDWSCQAVWYQYNSLEGRIAKRHNNFTKKLETYLQI